MSWLERCKHTLLQHRKAGVTNVSLGVHFRGELRVRNQFTVRFYRCRTIPCVCLSCCMCVSAQSSNPDALTNYFFYPNCLGKSLCTIDRAEAGA